MSDAKPTQGTIIARGDGGSPEDFTPIAEIFSASNIDGGQAAEIDVTHFGSTSKEYLLGLQDSGEVTLEGNFISTDAEQQGLREDRRTRTVRSFRITLVDGTQINFQALVKAFPLNLSKEDAARVSITLRVTGDVDFVYPT